jgi:hypothetical protein
MKLKLVACTKIYKNIGSIEIPMWREGECYTMLSEEE